MTNGRVIKAEANYYTVSTEQAEYLCTIRANLKKAGKTIRVGDRVKLDGLQDERAVITTLHPRRNALVRPAIANVDQVLIVMSAHEPDFNTLMVDRLLVLVRYSELQPILCVNKSDLLETATRNHIEKTYHPTGNTLLFLSAKNGIHIMELHQLLHDRVSIMAGPSGVGKSSILNALSPGLALRTRSVNEKMGLGKHTTRHVSLHSLSTPEHKGWLADSPGFSNLEIPLIDPAELAFYYPEYLPHIRACKFHNCLHRHELDCAVKDNIDPKSPRYINYLSILEEVEEQEKQRRQLSSKQEKTVKQKATGQNQNIQLLKIGAADRAGSRHSEKQGVESIEKWANFDPEWLEDDEF